MVIDLFWEQKGFPEIYKRPALKLRQALNLSVSDEKSVIFLRVEWKRMETKQLQAQCRQMVPKILANKGWKLVPDETIFLEEVIGEVQRRLRLMRPTQRNRRPIGQIIQDATVNRYNHLLYASCQAKGTPRQRLAFMELHQYLYNIAKYRSQPNKTLAEECTQESLVNLWLHLDQIRDPGSFMGYARMIIVREVNKQMTHLKTRETQEVNLTDLATRRDEEDVLAPSIDISLSTNSTPENKKPELTTDHMNTILAVIRHCLKRSKQRQDVIIGLFIEKKTVKILAEELDTLPQNIYLLTKRARDILRKCRDFLQLVEDFL